MNKLSFSDKDLIKEEPAAKEYDDFFSCHPIFAFFLSLLVFLGCVACLLLIVYLFKEIQAMSAYEDLVGSFRH